MFFVCLQMNRLLRQNTPIAEDIAGVQVGTISVLSSGRLLVPFNLYLKDCRAGYLNVRNSLTQNLQGTGQHTFDSNNVIYPETFDLSKLSLTKFAVFPK